MHYSDEVTKHTNEFIKCDLNENSTNKEFKLFKHRYFGSEETHLS